MHAASGLAVRVSVVVVVVGGERQNAWFVFAETTLLAALINSPLSSYSSLCLIAPSRFNHRTTSQNRPYLMNIISPDPGSSTDTLTPPIGSTSAPIPLKRRRITRACDRCHKGGIKCAQGRSEGTCGPCESFGERCTYDRPLKRRGPSARIDGATTKGVKKVGKGGLTRVDDGLVSAAMENVAMMNANMNVRMTGVPGSLEVDEVDDYAGWRAEHTASPSIIEHLVDAFHRIVYPM